MANFRGLMIIAIVLLIGAVQAPNPPHTVGQGKQSADDANTKGPVCRHPVIVNCYASIYPEIDWGVVGWFYHSPFKSCRPVYSPNGVHNCTENQSLPSTREMCEDLCSEPCIMSNGSTGICTLDEVCYVVRNIVTANPRPCGSSNVNCCPKVTDSSLVPFEDLLNKNYRNFTHQRFIHFADQWSSENDTLYVYTLPKN